VGRVAYPVSAPLSTSLPMLRERLAEAVSRADEVERALGDPEVARDARRFVELGREHHRLTAVVDVGRRLERAERELIEARELLDTDDPSWPPRRAPNARVSRRSWWRSSRRSSPC
jgi:hypothetical protein